ncbi:MAG: phosphoglycerate kinase [Alphaproteobacteria bacterium]
MPLNTLDNLIAANGDQSNSTSALQNKVVLVRCDLNVPMANGQVSDATRIQRTAPTLRELCDQGAKVVVLSHFGRPKGKVVSDMSLGPIRKALQSEAARPVNFVPACHGPLVEQALDNMIAGEILLLENTRFNAGEEANDAAFAKALAAVGDAFVNDAFSAAHRAHASTEGIAKLLPAYAGRAMQLELENLSKALETPEHPVIALVGGAKVSTKLALIENLMVKADHLIIGGAMANTFLAAQGSPIGTSLYEPDLIDTAKAIWEKSKTNACELLLPLDVVAAESFDNEAPHKTYKLDQVPADRMILDVGPATIEMLAAKVRASKTLVWNGPLGAFEMDNFAEGTSTVAQVAAEQTAEGELVSVAGGGDTVAALAKADVLDNFTYVSTAGGAFLEWLEGQTLPGVAVLIKS